MQHSARLMKYTNLPAALHILSQRRLTLLDPARWDDRNDAHFMKQFSAATGAARVLATCFTQTADTYHHWRVFAGGSDGIRLEIDKAKLMSAASRDASLLCGEVSYLEVNAFRQRQFAVADLPFIKRRPYADEREFRILRLLKSQNDLTWMPIRLSWIKRITISPWMPPDLADVVKTSLKAIDGCAKLKVYQSTLINNRDWTSRADEIAADR